MNLAERLFAHCPMSWKTGIMGNNTRSTAAMAKSWTIILLSALVGPNDNLNKKDVFDILWSKRH